MHSAFVFGADDVVDMLLEALRSKPRRVGDPDVGLAIL
jgi:hypothetical protein